MANAERASRVCSICKARKKACDKHLPTCGYCQKRGLVCSYEAPPATGSGIAVDPAWYHFIPAPINQSGISWDLTAAPHSTDAQINDEFEQSQLGAEPRSFNEAIHAQVWRYLQLAKLSTSDITERYFRGFHRWLPIVSPEHFQKDIDGISDGSQPPADVAVLLLAMSLMVFNPPHAGSGKYVDAERLFLAVKTLFTQVQATVTASLRLAQTILIISAYEYASGRPEAAFISSGTCARLAAVLGFDKNAVSDNTLGDGGSIRLKLAKGEEWNVWWAVVVLERIILFEMISTGIKPTTSVPSSDTELPSSLGAAPELHAKTWGNAETSYTGTSAFGRQAQAIYLLDQLMKAIDQPEKDDEKLPQLLKLDDKLRAFMEQVLKEGGRVRGLLCGTIATIIRSLFLLHRRVLDMAKTSPLDPIAEQWQQSSQFALDTAAKMMLDVAHDHLGDMLNVDALPLCCAYNLRAARQVIGESPHLAGGPGFFENLESLLTLERVFKQRWHAP